MSQVERLKNGLKSMADPKRAAVSLWFFKTGPGQYGAGDKFLGLTSEQIKQAAKKFCGLDLNGIEKLLKSKIHEERAAALRILVARYQREKEEKNKKQIVNFYLRNSQRVNNWDLVDMSAPYILGDYLLTRPRSILNKLARSKNLWQRRISVIATLAFIRAGQFDDTRKICESLLNDQHDLIHKAAGWMLREVGKRKEGELKRFLNKHYLIMPRVMLRYAIEKLNPRQRARYLSKG